MRYSEDNLFSACAGYRAASFFYLKGQGLYEYHRNPGSITTTHKADAWESYKRMHQKLCALFQNCPEYDFSRQLDLHIIHYACAALGGVCALPKVEQKSEIDRILNDEALKRALQNRPVRHIPFKLAIQLLCMQYRACRLCACGCKGESTMPEVSIILPSIMRKGICKKRFPRCVPKRFAILSCLP